MCERASERERSTKSAEEHLNARSFREREGEKVCARGRERERQKKSNTKPQAPNTKHKTQCLAYALAQAADSDAALCFMFDESCIMRYHVSALKSTTLSSKVNLLHIIDFRVLCSANLVTKHPEFEGERNPRTPPCGLSTYYF